jgi:hypothetical protein
MAKATKSVTNDVVEMLEGAVRAAQQLLDPEMDRVRFCSAYSGRSMYGRTCPSIAGTSYGLTTAMAQLDDYERALLGRYRTDSMGKGSVWYWPEFDTTNLECPCKDCA